LFGALKEGVKYIWTKFHCNVHRGENSPYKATMFTEDQLETLAPILLFAFKPENQEKVGRGAHSVIGGRRIFIRYHTQVKVGWTGYGHQHVYTLDLDTPDFAKQFVSLSAKAIEEYQLHRCIDHIKISGQHSINGVYRKYGDDVYVYHKKKEAYSYPNVDFFVAKSHFNGDSGQDWAIIAFQGTTFPPKENDDTILHLVCWISPCSQNLSFPPRYCWTKGPGLEEFQTKFNMEMKGCPKLCFVLNERML
jgi:hypothetical protein